MEAPRIQQRCGNAWRVVLSCAFVAALSACGGGGDSGETPGAAPGAAPAPEALDYAIAYRIAAAAFRDASAQGRP